MKLHGPLLRGMLFATILIAACGAASGQPTFADPAAADAGARSWTAENVGAARDFFVAAAAADSGLTPAARLRAHRRAAELGLMLGERASAIAMLRAGLDIPSFDGDASERARILATLAQTAIEDGNERESARYRDEARRVAEAAAGTAAGTPAEAAALKALGEYQLYLKKPSEARATWERALATLRRGNDREGEAGLLILAGYASVEEEKFAAGIGRFDEALALARAAGERRDEALALAGLGLANNLIGEKQRALDFYLAAERLFPANLDAFDQAVVANGVGSIYEDYGEWKLSLDRRTRALDLYRRSGNLFGQLATLPSLALLSTLAGNDADVPRYANEANRLATRLRTPYYHAMVSKILGEFHLRRGRPAVARASFAVARNLFLRSGFLREIPLIDNRVAELDLQAGRIDESEQLLRRSLDAYETVPNPVAESETHFLLARISARRGDIDAAVEYGAKSVELTEKFAGDVLNGNLRRNFFTSVVDRYDFFIGQLMDRFARNGNPEDRDRALGAAERSKARVMLENIRLSRVNFRQDADPDALARERDLLIRLQSSSDRLADAISRRGERDEEAVRLTGEIDSLTNELEDVRVELRRRSPVYAAVSDPPPFDLAAFQRSMLDEKTLFLEYSLGEKASFLWAVGHDSVDSFVLPSRAVIEGHVSEFRATLGDRVPEPEEEPDAYRRRIADLDSRFAEAAARLSAELLGPLAGRIGGRRLVIVADGKLLNVPFSALPHPDSPTGEPLIASAEVASVPSAQSLVALTSTRRAKPATSDLLILSDPVFSVHDSRLTGRRGGDDAPPVDPTEDPARFRYAQSLDDLPRLAASSLEQDSVGALVGGRKVSLTGFDASRERLLRENIADFRIIHFATHGIVDEENPELSGIVLSRFDVNGRRVDETLRLNDIYSLGVNADLVVLSACRTGLGKEYRGEGLASLNNAFLQAGSRSVVSTLWQVEDGATLELMKHFYASLVDKRLPAPAALRDAQLALRADPRYRSPFYWAAFAAQGEFNNATTVSARSWLGNVWLLALAGIVALVAAGLAVTALRRRAGNRVAS